MKKWKLTLLLLLTALLCASCTQTPIDDGQSAEDPETPAVITRKMQESDRPCLVQTMYPTASAVVADIIATDAQYGADPTGTQDSTDAIRRALSDCAENGGGTVYLPAGSYRVSGSIEIPAFTTLHGDWLDPDTVENPSTIQNYGTLILSYQESSENTEESLFRLRGSAGVIGVTVYYPEQDLDNVKPYPFTFYFAGNGLGGYMLATVQNCTVLNGYAGIGACVSEGNAHEMLTIENVRGTFLSVGAEAYNQADVGTWKSVRISPDYWANAGAGLAAVEYDRIAAYMRAHTVGLKLGDLEWTQLSDLCIESCRIGITTVPGKRISFAGTMLDVTVRACDIALDAQDLDDRWGLIVARSSLDGSVAAVRNDSAGVVKMTDVTLSGEVAGQGNVLSENSSLAAYPLPYDRSYVEPTRILYTAPIPSGTDEDVSALLQQALNEVGVTGGILYLTPGVYRLDSPVVVPRGVELRGASSVATRDQSDCSRGTILVTAYGVGAENPENMPALLTLSENAGLFGVRIWYNTNSPAAVTPSPTPYAVRGDGAEVYVVNCSIAAAGSGIDFRGCDRHFIKKFVGCCYDTTICVGGRDGYVEGCLQNGTVLTRGKIPFPDGWITEEQIFELLFPVLRRRSVLLTLDGADGETVLNCFAYGVSRVVVMQNSQNAVFCNLGGDNIMSNKSMFYAEDSRGVVINMMRYNGTSYRRKGDAAVDFYNRLTISSPFEKNEVGGETRDYTSLSQ